MAVHPQTVVAVTGGGSGTGIAALISGTCELAAVSRQMTQKEIAQATARQAHPQEYVVALDGIAVAVHPENPVKRLTMSQLAGIFSGTIRNWSLVGGRDARIVLLSREVNSGTHVYFKEHVMGKMPDGSTREFSPDALLLSSSQAIVDELAVNADAIGYYGMGYLNPKNTAVAVAATADGPYVEPAEAAVRDGTYPISRPLFLYSRDAAQGLVQAFVEFALSAQGQAIVRQVDFVPMAHPS
jgi:phosphate transport system substrate-binding protein